METRTKCPYCSEEYIVDDSTIGHLVMCKSCEKSFIARKFVAVSPPQISLPNSSSFSSNNAKTDSQLPSPPQKQQSSVASKGKKQLDHECSTKTRNLIKDFFDFKIMIIPSLVRLSFLFFFIISSLAALAYPFKTANISTAGQILLCVVIVFIGIPVWALILHAFYELTIIPFSILDTLNEIKNKLDEKKVEQKRE